VPLINEITEGGRARQDYGETKWKLPALTDQIGGLGAQNRCGLVYREQRGCASRKGRGCMRVFFWGRGGPFLFFFDDDHKELILFKRGRDRHPSVAVVEATVSAAVGKAVPGACPVACRQPLIGGN